MRKDFSKKDLFRKIDIESSTLSPPQRGASELMEGKSKACLWGQRLGRFWLINFKNWLKIISVSLSNWLQSKIIKVVCISLLGLP